IYLMDPYYNSSYANPQSSEIHLTDSTNALHEMVHVLLAENAPKEMYWMREALAEYYSLDDSGEIFPQHEVSNGFEGYLEFFADEVAKCEPNEDDMKFHRSVWAIYERLCSPEAETEGRDDRMAYEMAYGISSLLLEGLERDQIRFKYDRSVGWGYDIPEGPKERAGDNLSYPESLAVMKYLAGIYGAEKLTADHLEGLTSKESIGLTWPEIYAAAMEYYEREYGELISRD
ncbi:MAG: hypothetical protein J6P98_07750, partial [Clostridia bacterium]|nr:hypothetical protein [Clostridia bacterium]